MVALTFTLALALALPVTAGAAGAPALTPWQRAEATVWADPVAVVCPDRPDALELEAARLVVRVLAEATGEPSALYLEKHSRPAGPAIFIGRTRRSEATAVAWDAVDRQAGVLAPQAEGLILRGGSALGTRLCAARYLHAFMGARWYLPGSIGEVIPRRDGVVVPTETVHLKPSFLQREILIGPREPQWSRNNGLAPRYDYNHNLHRVLPNSLQDEHPEWFAKVNGRLKATAPSGAQPHLASPSFAAYSARWAAQQFRADSSRETVSLSLNDSVIFDERPETVALVRPVRYFRERPDVSPLVFTYMNRVAEKLYGWGDPPQDLAHTRLSALAYFWWEDVPPFFVHPRVMPWLTADRAQWFDPAFRDNDRDLIRRWTYAGPELLGTWDYYCGRGYLIPRYYPSLVVESLQYLHQEGVQAFFAQGGGMFGFDGPRLWLAAQLLWDIKQDPQALLDAFFEDVYGPAAPPMRAFFDRCEAIWMNQPRPARWLKYFESPAQLELFPTQVCDELRIHLDAALAAAQTDNQRACIRLTVEELAKTRAAAAYYETWRRAAALPTVPPPLREALSRTRERWLALAGRTGGPFSARRLRAHNPCDRGRVNLEGAVEVLSENFERALVPGDADGLGAPGTYQILNYNAGANGWVVYQWPTDANWFHRAADAGTDGTRGLRVAGSHRFVMRVDVPAEPGATYVLAAPAKGRISGDGLVDAALWFEDDGGDRCSPRSQDALPVGTHPWRTLTAVGKAPPRARTASVRIRVEQQYPGDFASLDQLRLLRLSPEAAQAYQPALP